jgi:uncharacterized membrane protein
LSKVPNSGTQPSFSLELVDLGIAFWIRGQKFGQVCTVCGGNLGMLLVFYSFKFLLLQVSMVAMVVRRKEKSKEVRDERERRESKKTET